MYSRSITDMCCCQLASAVAHLLPALTSSCLCFVAPKQGPDSGPKNGATILKLAAQLPNVWSQFWAHGVCVLPSAKSALSCDRLHLPFMFSCAWCQDAGFTCRVRSEGRQKARRPTAPKMGPCRSASQRNVSKGAGMPVLFCSKHDCHKQCQDMRTASGSIQDPGRNPRHPQISKLTYFRTLQSYTRKGSKTSFCEWQRWFLGSGAMFARAYPHTSRGSSVKLAIRIGLAAKLLSMCSKATKHGVAFRIGLAAKLLRMRSKATKDDFAIRIGSAAKLLRKCFKE